MTQLFKEWNWDAILDLCEFKVQPFPETCAVKPSAWSSLAWLPVWPIEKAHIREYGWYGASRNLEWDRFPHFITGSPGPQQAFWAAGWFPISVLCAELRTYGFSRMLASKEKKEWRNWATCAHFFPPNLSVSSSSLGVEWIRGQKETPRIEKCSLSAPLCVITYKTDKIFLRQSRKKDGLSQGEI